MRTEDVLEQIGQALDDWEVGPDAMRCAPEAPAYAAVPPRRPMDRFSFIPALSNPEAPTAAELSAGQDLTPYITAMDTSVSEFAAQVMDIDLLPFQRHWLDHWLDHWVAARPGDRVVLGFDGARDDITCVVARASARGYNVTLHLVDETRWQAAAEGHGPLRLPIDGHEYARRRRNRRRS